jgi:hypothetical protein
MAQTELPRDELSAAIEARRELGQELEPQVIDGFLDRVGKAIDTRVDERLAKRGPAPARPPVHLAVPLGSIALGIPLTGAAGGTAGFAGILIVWLGLVLVNFAYALRQ